MTDLMNMPFDDLWNVTQHTARASNLREPVAALRQTAPVLLILDNDYGRSPYQSNESNIVDFEPISGHSAESGPHDSNAFYRQMQSQEGYPMPRAVS